VRRAPGTAPWTAIPPSALVLTGIFSVQFGAGLAARLFTQIAPAAVTGLRLWTSAAVMVLVGARPLHNAVAGLVRRRAWPDAAVAVAFGLTLAIMNFSIYQSFARIPLGISVTVEFLGPLGVAVASSRRVLDVLWVGLAGTGVALLARSGTAPAHGTAAGSGAGHGDVLAGLAFALLAGLAWAAYIMLSRATGQRFPGSTGLAIAMVVAAIAITPVGVATGHAALLRPSILLTGLAIGLLSSIIPY
jgi:inner membrane transporter RhtA